MIKKIAMALVLFVLSTQLVANEHREHEGFYIVAKVLQTVGENVDHEGVTLKGDAGYGFGIDIGHPIKYGFSVEYDFSYSENKVSEPAEKVDATYMTHALDLEYTYHITHYAGIFCKVGVEYEKEKISRLIIDNDSYGYLAGIGVEYVISSKYNLLLEYEHSTIDSPRGDTVDFGVMYHF
ncbi:porin family protein [Sulfurimonas sp.]